MKFPPAVKNCLQYYDTGKMQLSNPRHRYYIIFHVLNNRWLTDEAIDWLQKTFTEKEIKAVIKDSYASEWWKESLKHWADYYQVCPKYKTRMEFLCRNDKDKGTILSTIDDNLWPYGGHVIWDEIRKYQE